MFGEECLGGAERTGLEGHGMRMDLNLILVLFLGAQFFIELQYVRSDLLNILIKRYNWLASPHIRHSEDVPEIWRKMAVSRKALIYPVDS